MIQPIITTRSGRRVDLTNPRPDDICIYDIAWALSHICRWTGHVASFYSVAEHSVLVSERVPVAYARAALMHDAAEAYIGDVSAPLKSVLPEYRRLEAQFSAVIAEKFNIQDVDHRVIHDEDKAIAESEFHHLHRGGARGPFGAYNPHRARAMFLHRAMMLDLVDTGL